MNRLDLSLKNLDGKIDAMGAELRTQPQSTGNRNTRNLSILTGVLLAALALFEVLLPLLRLSGS